MYSLLGEIRLRHKIEDGINRENMIKYAILCTKEQNVSNPKVKALRIPLREKLKVPGETEFLPADNGPRDRLGSAGSICTSCRRENPK